MALSEGVNEFRVKHTDTTTAIYDAHDLFTRVLDNPGDFGFDDNVCVSGEGCIWFDSFHPDSRFHKILSQDILRFFK
jgi:phospholipase/lecithinase/hemolysin